MHHIPYLFRLYLLRHGSRGCGSVAGRIQSPTGKVQMTSDMLVTGPDPKAQNPATIKAKRSRSVTTA
jgi:hypothetical protein